MKTFLTRPSYLLMVMLASLFYASCSDPEEEIATPTQQQQQQQNKNKKKLRRRILRAFWNLLDLPPAQKSSEAPQR